MKRMLLVVALLTIAGVEAKSYTKVKPAEMKMKKAGRMVETKKNAPRRAAAQKAVIGENPNTYTPKNLPQPKAPAKRKAARR